MSMFTEGVKFFQKAIVFHPENNQFLTLKRRPDDSSPNMWDLPGGGVDFGELHDIALEREILEETGLAIMDMHVVEVFTRYHDDTGIYVLFIGHQCQATHADVRMSSEHTAFQWVTAEEYQTLHAQPTLKELAAKASMAEILIETLPKNLSQSREVTKKNILSENEIAREIVDAAYKIHVGLGPGLLESVYEAVLVYELRKRGLGVTVQQPIPLIYEGVKVNVGFRTDLIVESKVIVELKAVEAVNNTHKKQLLTYLKVADKRLGLLINFNEALIKNGITRIANKLQENTN